MEDNNPPENRYNNSRHFPVPDEEICEILREEGHPTHGIVTERNSEKAQLDQLVGKQGYDRKKNRNRKSPRKRLNQSARVGFGDTN